MEKRLDGYIARIAAAQEKDPDGYLNTWTQLMAPKQHWALNGGNDVQKLLRRQPGRSEVAGPVTKENADEFGANWKKRLRE